MFTISIISEDTFSVEHLSALLKHEFSILDYDIESGIHNAQDTDLLIIIFSKKLTSDVSKYMNKYKDKILVIKNVAIIGGDDCSRVFKGLQKKSIYFQYINIKSPIDIIISELCLFIGLRIEKKQYLNNGELFTPEKRGAVVSYLAKGFTPLKIATIMRIDTKTISSHKRMAMERFGVKTTAELITKYTIIEEFIRPCEEALHGVRLENGKYPTVRLFFKQNEVDRQL